ncbi:MAG: glycosyltransferase, partial [Duncaniella sp.]|nr:glycosyltransferase [Duncaniella sp.]
TLKSISEQSCRLFQYIVVDGASKDDTVQLANNSGIENMEVYSEPDRGLYDAMNKGLGLAKGDYVIFLNAGDSFHSPDTLQHFADAIFANDYPGIVYGQTDIVDYNRNRLGSRHFRAPEVLTLESFSNGMVVCHQAFVALRKLTNNYDTRIRFSADYEWCIRCLQRSHRNCYLDEVVIDYLSEGVTTRNRWKSLIERFNIMVKYYGLFPTLIRHCKKVYHAATKKIKG